MAETRKAAPRATYTMSSMLAKELCSGDRRRKVAHVKVGRGRISLDRSERHKGKAPSSHTRVDIEKVSVQASS